MNRAEYSLEAMSDVWIWSQQQTFIPFISEHILSLHTTKGMRLHSALFPDVKANI